MAITLIGEKRTGNAAIRKSGQRLVYEEQWEFIVSTDDKNTRRVEVLTSNALPRVGLTLSGGGFAVCSSVDAVRREGNPLIWDATAQFSSEVEEDSSGANESESGNPTAWVPIAELNYETYTEYTFEDRNGDPFVNGAGFPFQTGLPRTRTLTRFDFEQFEPETTTVDQIEARNETVNENSFLNRDAGTLRLVVNSAKIGFYYGFRVWRISYSLVHKKDTWAYRVYNVGNTYKDGANFRPYLDTEGNRITGFLTSTGAKSTTPTTIEADVYDELAFESFLRV